MNSSKDDSILTTTEIISENNSDDYRYFHITMNNYLDYGEFTNTYYRFKSNTVQSGDWVCIDSDVIDYALEQGRNISCSKNINLTFYNMTSSRIFRFLTNDSTFINCYLPGATVGSSKQDQGFTKLINSTVFAPNVHSSYYKDFPTISLDENSKILSYMEDNTYPYYYKAVLMDSYYLNGTIYTGTFFTEDDFSNQQFQSRFKVNDSSIIRVFKDEASNQVMILKVDRPLFFEGMTTDSSFVSRSIHFISGSMSSTANNIIFNQPVIFEESGITITNCTFNKGVIFNNVSDIIIKDCIFNSTENTPIVMISSSENTIENNVFIDSTNNENNTSIYMIESSTNIIRKNNITTVNQYTIQGDDESTNNKFTENILKASTTKDKESTNINENNNYTESKAVRYNTTISIELNNQTNIHITDKVPVSVTVFDEDNNPVTNGEVEIYVDGIFQLRERLTDGVLNTEVAFDRVNTNASLKVWYYADDTYYDNVANISPINVEKANVVITASEIVGYVGDNITLEANITTESGNLVNEGNVYFIFGSTRYSVQVIDGRTTYTTEILPEWIDLTKVTIQYFNSTNFVGNNIRVTPDITVKPILTQVSMDEIIGLTSQNTTLKAIVTDENSTAMNEGSVTFSDSEGNIIAEADVIDGIATATVIFNDEMSTTLTATYTPSSVSYSKNSTTATLEIQKPQTIIDITDVDITAGETVTLTATVQNQLGNNIDIGKIVFKVNGKSVKDVNGKVIYAKVVNGVATVQYNVANNLMGKELNITATYLGNSKYNKANTTITKTANAKELSLTTEDVQVAAGSTVNLTATLNDNSINTGKIVFKINGKTIKDTNGKVIYAKVVNGQVSVEYTLPESMKAKNYNITAVYIPLNGNKLEDTKVLTVN